MLDFISRYQQWGRGRKAVKLKWDGVAVLYEPVEKNLCAEVETQRLTGEKAKQVTAEA